MWILHNEKLVPCAQIEIALEPGAHRTEMTDDVIERFHTNDDWSAAGLKAALMLAQTLPSRLEPPPGSDAFVNYFKRHEPHVHEMLRMKPDLIWRAYYGGAIPSGFEGFDKDYEDTLLTKMVSYHEPVDVSRQDELLTHLRTQIVKPSDPFFFMWMADYARRTGFNDVQSLEDGSQVQSGILSLPPTSGPNSRIQKRATLSMFDQLYDEIVIEIMQFGMRRLSDWVTIQKVCRRFRVIANKARALRHLKLKIDQVRTLRRRCNMVMSLHPFKLNCANINLLTYVPRLTSLEIHGSIAIDDATPISGLEHLKSLSLVQFWCSSIRNMLQYAKFDSLEVLYMYNCKAFHTMDLKLLGRFAKLTTLELHHLRFDPAALLELHTLSNLKHFTIVNNTTIEDLNFIKPWQSLESLRLNSCRSLVDINAIRDLTRLESLDLDFCDKIDPDMYAQITAATVRNKSS